MDEEYVHQPVEDQAGGRARCGEFAAEQSYGVVGQSVRVVAGAQVDHFWEQAEHLRRDGPIVVVFGAQDAGAYRSGADRHGLGAGEVPVVECAGPRAGHGCRVAAECVRGAGQEDDVARQQLEGWAVGQTHPHRSRGDTGLLMSSTDTDMMSGWDIPKNDPADVVRQALDGLEAGALEVLADEDTRLAKAALSADPGETYGEFLTQSATHGHPEGARR